MWDYTCKHTLTASNVKRKKYSELAKENHYIPIAQETLVIVRSDEFNDRGKVGIKARSPIHLMFIKITLPNIGRRPRVIACKYDNSLVCCVGARCVYAILTTYHLNVWFSGFGKIQTTKIIVKTAGSYN